jgi:hypothetical protein
LIWQVDRGHDEEEELYAAALRDVGDPWKGQKREKTNELTIKDDKGKGFSQRRNLDVRTRTN